MGAVRRSYTPEQLETIVRALTERDGIPPSTIDLDSNPELPGFHHFAKHFGSYTRALELWGLPVQYRGKSKRAEARREAERQHVRETSICETRCMRCAFSLVGTIAEGDKAFWAHRCEDHQRTAAA